MKNRKCRVRWSGYEPDEDSWLNWKVVKDLATLDKYSQIDRPFGTQIGLNLDTLCENWFLVTKSCAKPKGEKNYF